MKLRIGSIEIVDPTWEELDKLISRYGGDFEIGTNASDPENPKPTEKSPGGIRRGNGGHRPADRVVLERLVEAGATGVPTQDIGEILGRLGKSIRPALFEWAKRIELVHDNTVDPFEECRSGTRRGIRIKDSMTPVATRLLKDM